jgi:hypothetical protein
MGGRRPGDPRLPRPRGPWHWRDVGLRPRAQAVGAIDERGPTILFDDHNVPVTVTPGTIEWEVAYNTYTLNRATLELAVIGRIYVCQRMQRQL